LFNAYGSGIWYITEYNPQTKVAFGYVEWLVSDSICDEWWYISIEELANLRSRFNIPMIEVDVHFKQNKFWDITVRG
jgi:hypothetical protein